MKAHEETWQVASGAPAIVVQAAPGLPLVANFEDEARAKLAAQAPAMARLLVLTMDYIFDEESEHWQAIRRVLLNAGVLP